jgi:hypothetical protein
MEGSSMNESILAVGMAKKLLAQLRRKPLFTVAVYPITDEQKPWPLMLNGECMSFSLRRSYVGNPTNYQGTGGMLLKAAFHWPFEWCSTRDDYSRVYRLKPAQVPKAKHFIALAITRWIKEWSLECGRLAAIDKVVTARGVLWKKLRTMGKRRQFLDWVDLQARTNVYIEMTKEDAEWWLAEFAGWQREFTKNSRSR